MQIEMTIKGLMVDPITNMPIIILRDKDGQRVLPIWVGVFEANAIALQIENVTTPRPMTHDLLKNVIQDLRARIEQIVVSDLKENTFYALIYLTVGGELMAGDARPSDAIALALRARAPIFVEEKVIDHILGLAKPVDKKVTAEELLKPDPREDALEHLGHDHDHDHGHDHAHDHGHDHDHGHHHHGHDHGHDHSHDPGHDHGHGQEKK